MPVVHSRSGLDGQRERARAVLPALLVVLAGLSSCARPPRPRLVVLVVVDTLRADHLTQYGYARDTSRALDRFASHATLFTDCHAPASWTTPSTASILTGLLPARHGADARGAALGQEALTLAEVLGSASWETAGISFNHNVCVATQFDQGFQRFRDHRGDGKEYPDVSELLATASEWVETSRAQRLFLYLQPMNVHGPYLVPEARAADLLGAPPERDFRYSKGLMDRIMKEGRLDQRAKVDAAYLDSHRDQYDTAVRYTMDELGGWLSWLEREGLYDEALIVVTADHGEELYDHGGFSHGYSLFEECIRVPLFVKLPGQREAGVVADRVALLDLVPTLLAHAGIVAEPALPGESLLPLCTDGGDAGVLRARLAERTLVARTHWPKRFQGEALISGTHKLIAVQSSWQHVEPATMLFDLAADPHELEDLALREPRLVDHLARALQSAARRTDPDAQSGTLNVRATFQPEELEALGY